MSSALEGCEWSASRPGRNVPTGKTRYLLYRRLGGPQGRSGQVRKISPTPGFAPRTVQPVVSRYTDWATQPTQNTEYVKVSTVTQSYVILGYDAVSLRNRMRSTRCLKRSGSDCPRTQRHTTWELNLQQHRCESFRIRTGTFSPYR
jgi:hypothetical protein